MTGDDQHSSSLEVTYIQSSPASGEPEGSDKITPMDWEARYWDLFDYARDLIHIYDPEGRFIAVNKRWIEVLGYSKEEAREMWLPDIIHPDHLEACLATFVDFDKSVDFDKRIAHAACDTVFVAKDGHIVYVTGNMVPYRENGKLVKTRHIFTDVSFSKQAEAVLKGLGEGLIVTDKERNITLSNEAATRMLGKKIEDLLGHKWPNVLGPHGIADQEGKEASPSKLPFYIALTKSEKSFTSDYQYMGKEGKAFPVAISAAPVILAGETTGVVEVFRDVTEEKAAERLKDDLINNTSHELKTPLIPIKSQTELLLAEDYGTLNEAQKKAVQMILRNETHLENLIDDVIAITKIRSGKLNVFLEDTDPTEIITNAVLDMEELAKAKRLVLTLQPIPELPTLSLDRKLTTQVLGNLLSNALKFTPKGGKVIVEVSSRAEPATDGKKALGEVVISVKDTGIGMSKETLEKLFTPFFQADSDTARRYGGAGLGLSICKGMVEAHGGTIWAESDGEGKGTTIGFTLPIQNIS